LLSGDLLERHPAVDPQHEHFSLLIGKLAPCPFQLIELLLNDRRIVRPHILGWNRVRFVKLAHRMPAVGPNDISGAVHHAGCQIAFETAGESEAARQPQQGQEDVLDNVLGGS